MIKQINPMLPGESNESHIARLEKAVPNEEDFHTGMKLLLNDPDKLPTHIRKLLEDVNDMGPLYGFQWRHWTKYEFATEYGYGEHKVDSYQKHPDGIDQLAEVVHKIMYNPNDRGMIVSSWNVSDLPEMILRPCHACHINHYVRGEYLDVHMVQRSCDAPIGVPVNITFYALYVMVLAKLTGKKPGKLHWCGENVHIYEDQIEPIQELLKREPMELPTVDIVGKLDCLEDLKNLKVSDFILKDYKHHPKLFIPVAV